MIAVVDYRKGNLKSVERGLAAAGGNACVTDEAAVIACASAIVLPGVGAFADAAATMCELGQMDVLRERIREGVPFLGICLGLHLLFSEGVEGAKDSENARGLGILPGVVGKMPAENAAGAFFKVPHVGWNSVVPAAVVPAACQPPERADASDGFACPLLEGVAPGEFFYFTHSYVAPASEAAVAVTEHSVAFPSVVQIGEAAFGVQFHPEKSSDAGARVLRNFVRIAEGA